MPPAPQIEVVSQEVINAAVKKSKNKDTANASEVVDPRGGSDAKRALNEKVKEGKPPAELSNLWYSIYGHENYPGYFTGRFTENRNGQNAQKLDELDAQLKQLREDIADAKADAIARDDILSSYEPLHPKLLDMTLEDILTPQVWEAYKSGDMSSIVTHETPTGVISLPLVQHFFCDLMMEESANFINWQNKMIEQKVPGWDTLSSKFCVVDQMGPVGSHVLDTLFKVHQVLSKEYFKTIYGDLDYRYGYVIGYAPDGKKKDNPNVVRQGLISHSDDSEVTFNLCLRDQSEYEGGEIVMHGLRFGPNENGVEARMKHRKGYVNLHLGQHMHEVEDVTSGQRQVLIIWGRSSTHRASNCPCCRMHRRPMEQCVFEPSRN